MGKLAKALGANVKGQRMRLGLTQAQLAEQAGLSEEWIRRIEGGGASPSLSAVEALGAALGRDGASLFSDPENPDQHLNSTLVGLTSVELRWLNALAETLMARPGRE